MMPLRPPKDWVHTDGAGLANVFSGIAAAKRRRQVVVQHLTSIIPDKNACKDEIG